MNKEFVVIWATTKVSKNDCWLMVLNRERGWELPGGKIEKSEKIDEAGLRELYEETGLLGVAKAYDDLIIEDGYVLWIEVDIEPGHLSWESKDASIEEVGWCVDFPERLSWSVEEINKVRNHDWSASKRFKS
ncbi:MAG: hypothetical protein CND89_02585 [Marine Group II euryarchaeote MED-G38]|nr:hypothetical protein [Euryarchaeota archaeon]OUV26136.1 MAG: hypothetical protein CBC57_03405 [Euryarchaeota archaeon TMED97]PDH22951.1 MAG: hypothetical protein CND89_02585 [Marine Group II euryarchaeote MED-G38]|tara:strand:+ start:10024 stop:10419 length:396 start_codon:yes stop_codon:yes gene_type:complete